MKPAHKAARQKSDQRARQHWPTDANKDWGGIDVFRFDEDGKFVEYWDVLQVVPTESAHGNTMF